MINTGKYQIRDNRVAMLSTGKTEDTSKVRLLPQTNQIPSIFLALLVRSAKIYLFKSSTWILTLVCPSNVMRLSKMLLRALSQSITSLVGLTLLHPTQLDFESICCATSSYLKSKGLSEAAFIVCPVLLSKGTKKQGCGSVEAELLERKAKGVRILAAISTRAAYIGCMESLEMSVKVGVDQSCVKKKGELAPNFSPKSISPAPPKEQLPTHPRKHFPDGQFKLVGARVAQATRVVLLKLRDILYWKSRAREQMVEPMIACLVTMVRMSWINIVLIGIILQSVFDGIPIKIHMVIHYKTLKANSYYKSILKSNKNQHGGPSAPPPSDYAQCKGETMMWGEKRDGNQTNNLSRVNLESRLARMFTVDFLDFMIGSLIRPCFNWLIIYASVYSFYFQHDSNAISFLFLFFYKHFLVIVLACDYTRGSFSVSAPSRELRSSTNIFLRQFTVFLIGYFSQFLVSMGSDRPCNGLFSCSLISFWKNKHPRISANGLCDSHPIILSSNRNGWWWQSSSKRLSPFLGSESSSRKTLLFLTMVSQTETKSLWRECP